MRDRVLIVDDDEDIQSLLEEYLRKNGFDAHAVANGKAMREALALKPASLVVLDLMLPGEDGLSLCRQLRSHSQVPVLMLTARGEAVDRILGLEMGADDYLAKPFDPRELLARIRSILRRAKSLPTDTEVNVPEAFGFSEWRLDTRARNLCAPDGVVALPRAPDGAVALPRVPDGAAALPSVQGGGVALPPSLPDGGAALPVGAALI
jgi:two-component system OmpR family response regulator